MDFKDTKPETEDVNTTLPDPDAFRRGYASWHQWKTDSKFVVTRAENSTAVISTIGFRILVPTLFTY